MGDKSRKSVYLENELIDFIESQREDDESFNQATEKVLRYARKKVHEEAPDNVEGQIELFRLKMERDRLEEQLENMDEKIDQIEDQIDD